ncbi:MAG: M48 family metalloprotease [Deltaproteobacteria bacterium]|nr:M48 family metalloprotease [Deltaproteobacteria bacterium]
MSVCRSSRTATGFPILLCVVAGLLAACGSREVEPEVLRYFTADVVHRHDHFKAPLRWNLLASNLVYLAFAIVFMGWRLNRRLKLRCEAVAAGWGESLGKLALLPRMGKGLGLLWGDGTWGGALLFTLAYLGIQVTLNLPSAFYFSWWYEHAHGTSVEPLWRWLWDSLKALVGEAVMLSMLSFGLYGLARRRRNWWLLLGVPGAVGIFALGGLLDPLHAQIYFRHERLAEGPVKERVVEVLEKAKVEYEDIFQETRSDVTRRTNAYIAGEGPTRRIVLWDTLIRLMTPDEIANAVAHELGHLRDRSPGRLVYASLALVPMLWALAWALRRLGRRRRFGFDDDRDVASLPMVFFLQWLVSFGTDPVAAAYGRHLERRADQYAFELLEQPEAFRAMQVKLARSNLADVHPPAWVRYLIASHPPVMERIEAAERFAWERGIPMREPSPELFSIPQELDPLQAAQKKEEQ